MIELGILLDVRTVDDKVLDTVSDIGFRSVCLSSWGPVFDVDYIAAASMVHEHGLRINTVSSFGNTLEDDDVYRSLLYLIDNIEYFDGANVSCFAGRKNGCSVEDSMDLFEEKFSTLVEHGRKAGIHALTCENCRMGDLWKRGRWNIAINDDAWNLMFERIDDPMFGLQWEPCHQVEAFVDVYSQLDRWLKRKRILSMHGKDARLNHLILEQYGLYGKKKPFEQTLPFFGDTDWNRIVGILQSNGYEGAVNIEPPASNKGDWDLIGQSFKSFRI